MVHNHKALDQQILPNYTWVLIDNMAKLKVSSPQLIKWVSALEVAKASKQTVMETDMETVMKTGSMTVNVKEVRRV